ncbi:MAG: hypothetical protein GY799_12290 [Desulfobulbaceae bacterium]|nr:hypothetical protein [Desulfobulbaceae bacterium]
MEKLVTSLELSQQLKKAGVEQCEGTLFLWHWNKFHPEVDLCTPINPIKFVTDTQCRAFTAEELGETLEAMGIIANVARMDGISGASYLKCSKGKLPKTILETGETMAEALGLLLLKALGE